ncbi:LapA family protein [Pseudovibrio brasiliensis]|nr:LapA family protein [Pseudovibrio brasiliensis]KZK99894.1 hypothetical protein PsW74_02505 [Pseudovibrio sp. W74]KZL11724.1 hypothetical protein PsAD14_00635 [Pseudovibrio sp. Ad14]KZL27155.1 hypothetical protein PsWM33_01103 [Pseudovibrio sp. WM33]
MARFLRNLLLIPIAALLVVLAVANRHSTLISLNPFNPEDPMLTFNIPVFWLLFGAVGLGVMLGGVATWMRQGRFRKEARVQRREANQLKHEADSLRKVAQGDIAPGLPSPDHKKAA